MILFTKDSTHAFDEYDISFTEVPVGSSVHDAINRAIGVGQCNGQKKVPLRPAARSVKQDYSSIRSPHHYKHYPYGSYRLQLAHVCCFDMTMCVSICFRVVLQSGYIFAEDLNVINKKHKWNCS